MSVRFEGPFWQKLIAVILIGIGISTVLMWVARLFR